MRKVLKVQWVTVYVLQDLGYSKVYTCSGVDLYRGWDFVLGGGDYFD